MSRSYVLVLMILLTVILSVGGCKSYKEQDDELPDNAYRGTIHISADESFKPVVDAEVEVYESNHPGATIKVHYKTEADCLKDFAVDSIRMVIITRPYSESEKQYIIDSMKVEPHYAIIARDAVAVIGNRSAEDSMFSMDEIKQVLTGKFKKKLIPVFDGLKATSTVRFIVDSVLKGGNLSPDAVAAKSSEEVIDYVSKTPDALGFIGVSWVGNKDDSMQRGFLSKIRLMRIESADSADKYLWPVQQNIYERHYPMVRDLVYILKDENRGLAYRFAEFLRSQVGQLIIKRAYLSPTRDNFLLRKVETKE